MSIEKYFKPYKFPSFLEYFYREALIRMPGENRTVYLTFDDGPTPEITGYVLDLLKDYHAFATFFVIGDKIEKNKEILKRIQVEGHRVGNHTFRHLSAWKTDFNTYYRDMEKTQTQLERLGMNPDRLFRPPYGRISPRYVKKLKEKGYQTVLWSVLSLDYVPGINPQNSLEFLKKHVKAGDIVVFHDSVKAFSSLKKILPPLMEHLARQGYRFKTL